jgi:hypothetical protein
MARLAEVERQIDVLAREIEQLKLGEASAAPALPTTPSQSQVAQYGSAPRRPGVRREDRRAIGGYGESLYQNFAQKNQGGEPSSQTDQATQLARSSISATSSTSTSSSIPSSIRERGRSLG